MPNDSRGEAAMECNAVWPLPKVTGALIGFRLTLAQKSISLAGFLSHDSICNSRNHTQHKNPPSPSLWCYSIQLQEQAQTFPSTHSYLAILDKMADDAQVCGHTPRTAARAPPLGPRMLDFKVTRTLRLFFEDQSPLLTNLSRSMNTLSSPPMPAPLPRSLCNARL